MDENERQIWQRAGEVFGELVELSASARLPALEKYELTEAERERVVSLLASIDEIGILDGDLEQVGTNLDSDDSWAEGLTGRLVGNWRLDSLLGRGGMAAVYRAERQGQDFDQIAAIKLLNLVLRGSAEQLAFRRERQILARLRHPNIASLLDGGIAEDGTPFLVMELVEGERIDQYCENHQLDLRHRVQLIMEVCRAVAYAHRKLVLHRDLKPGNILVDQQGQIKLLDFGIGKLLDDDDPRTRTILRAYTPEYAAPEQIAEGEDSTTQTDIYALGGLLCKLLTGELPNLTSQMPAGIDKDLATVVAKCLRPEPERRYQSVEALSDDLNRWLENRPVHAVPDSLSYRLKKLVQRKAIPLAMASLLLIMLLGGIAGTSWQAREARIQAEQAQAQARRAETVRDFLAGVLSSAQQSRGEIPDALDILNAGSARARSELMTTDPLAAGDVLTVTGAARYALSNFDGALADFEDAIEVFLPLQPRPAAELAQLHWEIGRLLRVRGPSADAGPHYRQAIDWAVQAGLSEETLLRFETSLAGWKNEHEDPDVAAHELIDLIPRIESAVPNSSIHLDALNALTTAMALARWDLQEQIRYHEKRLVVAAIAYGENDGWIAYTLADAIPTFRNAGLPERALEIGYQAVAIADRIYTGPDALAVVVYCNMAGHYRHLGRGRDALAMYERYERMDRELKRANLHAESCWYGYAASLLLQGQPQRAREALTLAQDVLDRMGTDYPVNRLNLCGLEASSHRIEGRFDRAERMLETCVLPDWQESLPRAHEYQMSKIELAMTVGDYQGAAIMLSNLRAKLSPSSTSLGWLKVWLPSWWLARESGRQDLAATLLEQVISGMPTLARQADLQPMIEQCLRPESDFGACIDLL